jgi:hypothetical protein
MPNNKIAEAYVELGMPLAEYDKAQRKLFSNLRGVVAHGGTAGSSFAKAFFSPLTASLRAVRNNLKTGLVIGGVVGGIALKKGIEGTVMAASDLNETLSKVSTVFGEATEAVVKGAEEMAAKFGTPKAEFLDAAASIGLIGKAAGLTVKDAGGLSVKLAKLAADASSFYNVPLEEALLTMRSALVGEAEPIRKFGVLLNEAAVANEALRLGLAVNKNELTEGAKVQARASLIMSGMKDATGDLARTFSSTANRIKEVTGQAQNLGATLGQFLLPAAELLGRELSDIGKDFGSGGAFTDTAKAIGETLKTAARYVGILYRNFTDISDLFVSLGKDFGQHIIDGLASILNYLEDYARFVGQAIGSSIKDALFEATGGMFGAKSAPLKAPTYTAPAFTKSAGTKAIETKILSKEIGVGISRTFESIMGSSKSDLGKGLAGGLSLLAGNKMSSLFGSGDGAKAQEATNDALLKFPALMGKGLKAAQGMASDDMLANLGKDNPLAGTIAVDGRLPRPRMVPIRKPVPFAANDPVGMSLKALFGDEGGGFGSRSDRARQAQRNLPSSGDQPRSVKGRSGKRYRSDGPLSDMGPTPNTKAEFVGLEEMSKKIQLAALDKDNYPKRTVDLLGELVEKTDEVVTAVKAQKAMPAVAVGPA